MVRMPRSHGFVDSFSDVKAEGKGFDFRKLWMTLLLDVDDQYFLSSNRAKGS